MIAIAITQRVTTATSYPERRDALDQRWADFLYTCGLLPVIVPNRPEVALAVCSMTNVAGLILTGGDDLSWCGGSTPERDRTELALLAWAVAKSIPVIGICRGMQLLQHCAGVTLQPVAGHVGMPHWITLASGARRQVNSFHHLAGKAAGDGFAVLARSDDGIIEAIVGMERAHLGIMWHPERRDEFCKHDIALFHRHFCSPPAGLGRHLY